MEENTIKISHLLFMILMMGIVIIVGTYAWLSYRSNDTAMVLTIGEINNVQVTLSPYQFKGSLLPQVTYTGGDYTSVTAVNNSSTSRKIKLYYKINNIDTELISSDFKYTIERSIDGTNYSEYKNGNFSSASNGNELTILEENIPNNTTYQYKVYLWIDGSNSGQSYMQSKSFNGELRAEILSYNVTFDANGGIVNISNKVVSYGEQYGNIPTPTRDGYTFLGWNSKNYLNYNILNTTMQNSGIIVDQNGYISDSSPASDTRGWAYSYNSGWKLYLESGTYTISLKFNTQSTTGDNRLVIQNESETTLVNTSLANKSTVSSTFTLTNSENISIVAKGYNGIYRIQLEEGTKATEWEPYYITSDTTVVQNKDHTLTTMWQENS